MRCWAEGYCQKRGAGCSEYCDAYLLLSVIYKRSGLPKIYQYDLPLRPDSRDLAAFQALKAFSDDIVENVRAGRGVYLWGSTGNGKTSWVCKLANQFIRKVVFQCEQDRVVRYVTVPSYLEALRRQYDALEPDDTLERLADCELLILDDIGAEKPSEWVSERLYALLNERVNAGLATFFTSNLSIEALAGRLGDRTASRIRGSCMALEFVGVDRRGADV